MLPVPDDLAPDTARSAAVAVSATVYALARDEKAGRRPQRLLEPDLATWGRFRGQLGVRDLLALLLEDAAVLHAVPFDLASLLELDDPLEPLSTDQLAAWLSGLATQPLDAAPRDYLEDLARHLGLTARPAYSDLRKHQPNHRILELPGTGGRLAAYLVQQNPQLSLRDVFTIACGTWQEELLAGLIAVEFGVVGAARILRATDLAAMRDAEGVAYTHVIGLRPDKGGRFSENEIRARFASAEVVLV